MSGLTRGLIALLLGGVVAAVAGALAFLGPALIDPQWILLWGWVAFFVGPAVAVGVWALVTPAFASMLARGSVAPWVITGVALLPAIGVWLSMGEWLTGVVTRRWTEDVQLADGSVVTVERSVRIERSHSVELDASMKFTAELAYLPELRVPVTPLVLYMDEDTGEWVIVAITSSCEVLGAQGPPPRLWFAAERPPTRYLEFRSRSAGWVQTPLSAGSIGQRTNLFTRFEDTRPSHVTVATTGRWQRESGPAYQSVLQEPGYNCGRTSWTQPVWDAEDQILAALDRENATAEQRARVGELLAATRFVRGGRWIDAEWRQDTDPTTVEMVGTGAPRAPGVSDDGQVIYLNGPDRPESFKESYARRLSAAGLGQFAE